jgi:hypothetical protein
LIINAFTADFTPKQLCRAPITEPRLAGGLSKTPQTDRLDPAPTA